MESIKAHFGDEASGLTYNDSINPHPHALCHEDGQVIINPAVQKYNVVYTKQDK